MQTLDFLIGGVPRGGTTAFGSVLSNPPAIWCYAGETHWLSLLEELAGERPLPPAALSVARAVIEAHNSLVFGDMPLYNKDRGSPAEPVRFDARDSAALSDALCGLLAGGAFGTDLYRRALALLREAFSRQLECRVFGEKTPSNALVLSRCAPNGIERLVLVLREPFGVIRSMHLRAGDSRDVFASDFRGDLFGLCGIYSRYVAAITQLSAQRGTHVFTYESLLEASRPTVAALYAVLGVQCAKQALARAAASIYLVTPAIAWPGFTLSDRSLLIALTQSVREDAGYDAAFYAWIGLDVQGPPVCWGLDAPLLRPMSGHHARTGEDSGYWLMDQGQFAIYTDSSQRRVLPHFWSNIPVDLLAQGESATLCISSDQASPPLLGVHEAPGGLPHAGTIAIDLAAVQPVATDTRGELRLVRFRASHAYRCFLNAQDGPDGIEQPLGRDRRLLSFMLTGVEFENASAGTLQLA